MTFPEPPSKAGRAGDVGPCADCTCLLAHPSLSTMQSAELVELAGVTDPVAAAVTTTTHCSSSVSIQPALAT